MKPDALPLPGDTPPPAIPDYLEKVYWWAYLHPAAVRLFERNWLVNLILWGNFRRLRDAALDALCPRIADRVLQVACVYGDFTPRLAARLEAGGSLDVIDVAPIQLANLRRKLPADRHLRLHRQDAAALRFADASFDSTLLFFLLHEQPAEVRRATLAEALRVTRPGGRVVIVDYHRPRRRHPLHYPMRLILRTLEPFALDLWRHDIAEWLPAGLAPDGIVKTTCFGGLYQQLVIRRPEASPYGRPAPLRS